jgi:hypothetical protein
VCLVSLYQYSGGVKRRSVNNKEQQLKLFEKVEKRTMYWLGKYSWLVVVCPMEGQHPRGGDADNDHRP